MTIVVTKLKPAEYARRRGCSPQAVYRALREGRITADTDGLVDPVAADAQWAARSRPRVRAAPPAPPDARQAVEPGAMSYDEARRRQAVADALRAEAELRARMGELVGVAEVRAAIARRLIAARDVVLNIPARLAPVLAAETDTARVADLLAAELHEALAAMAQGGDDLGRDPLGTQAPAR